MIINFIRFMIVLPLSVYNVLILVKTGKQSQRYSEIRLAVLIGLLAEFFQGLPLGPTSSQKHLIRNILALRVPNKASLLSGTGSEVVIAAFLANGWHYSQIKLSIMIIVNQSTLQMCISKWGSLGLESDGILDVCRRWLKGYRLKRAGTENGSERRIAVGVMKFSDWAAWSWVCSLLSLRFGCITNDQGTGKG